MRLTRMKQDIQGLNLNDGNNYLVLKAIYFLYMAFSIPSISVPALYFYTLHSHIKKTSYTLITINVNILSDDDIVDRSFELEKLEIFL